MLPQQNGCCKETAVIHQTGGTMLKKAGMFVIVTLALVAVVAVAISVYGCTEGGNSAGTGTGTDTNSAGGAISVVSREDGSGTRSAFIELLKIQDENKVDQTTPNAVVTNSTAVMLTTVSGDKSAIGYISLGSLDNSVKALDIDGVAATTDNVKNGSYAVQRPFNLVTKGQISPVAQDFIDYILSSDGQGVIEGLHYVAVAENAKAYTAKSTTSGKVVVSGSSSVTPAIEALKEAYIALNPDVDIEIQTSDSSTGIQAAIDGICDIGMSSRDLKDTESAAGLEPTVIALDGIAIIVNTSSPLKGLTSEQVKDIYIGTVTTWEEVAG
jgi:phosphate transport system substrate-binding protein